MLRFCIWFKQIIIINNYYYNNSRRAIWFSLNWLKYGESMMKSWNHAIEGMQKELQNEGINKTVYQITKKMDNLRQNYKKNRPASTGGEPSTWRFFMLCINCSPPVIFTILIQLLSVIQLIKVVILLHEVHEKEIINY